MAQPPPPQAPPPMGGTRSNGLAIAGMILGIIGIVLAILLAFVGIILGIIGLILAIVGRNRANQTGVGAGQAMAGIITSAIAIVVGIANIALAFALFA